MTVQQQAYNLIEKMPDDEVSLLIEFIQRMDSAFKYSQAASENTQDFTQADQQLERIAQLKENWNGNGAPPFSRKLIHKVRVLLLSLQHQPEVFPTACDSIQLEYDSVDGRHLEIEITESDEAEMFYVDQNGLEQEEIISSSAHDINMIVGRFYGKMV